MINKKNFLLCTTTILSSLLSYHAQATDITISQTTTLNSDYSTLTFAPQNPGGSSGGTVQAIGDMTIAKVTSTFASPTPYLSTAPQSFIIGSTARPVTLTLGSVTGSNIINPITFSGVGNILDLSNTGTGYKALGLVEVSGGNTVNITSDSQYDLSNAVFSGGGTLNLTMPTSAQTVLGGVSVGTLNLTNVSPDQSSGALSFAGQVNNWTTANINVTSGNVSFNNGCITDAGTMNIAGGPGNTIVFSSSPGTVALQAKSGMVNIFSGNVTIANGSFGGNLTFVNDATLNLSNSAGILNPNTTPGAGNIILNQDNIGTISIANTVPTVTQIVGTIGSANRLSLLEFDALQSDILIFNGDVHTYKLQNGGGTLKFGNNLSMDAVQWNTAGTDIDLSGNMHVTHTGTMNILTDTTFVFDWSANNTITYSSPGIVSSTTSVPTNFSTLTLDTVTVAPGANVVLKLSNGSALPAYTNVPFFNLSNVNNADGRLANSIVSKNTFFDFAVIPVSPAYGAQAGMIRVEQAGINFGGIMSASGATDDGVEYAKGIASNLTGLTYDSSLLDHSKEVLALGYMNTEDQVNYVNKASNLTATHLSTNQLNTVDYISNSLRTRQQPLLISTFSGVASGDECALPDNSSTGVWVDGFGGIANQKTRKKVPGFKSNTYGAVLGADQTLNDNTVIGIAVGVAKSNLKHQSIKQGDKTKANTYTFSAYGSYDFGNNFIAQGNAMLGKTFAKSKEGHLSARTGNVVNSTSKHNSMLYSTELLGGYKKQLAETVHLIPMAGFKYASFGKISYTEIIPNGGNREIAVKSKNYFAGLLGANLQMSHNVLNDKTLNTNFKAFVEYDFLNKSPRANITLSGLNTPVTTGLTKPARTMYSLGLHTSLNSTNVEYGVGYTASIADKYLGHQGSIKVKVKL